MNTLFKSPVEAYLLVFILSSCSQIISLEIGSYLRYFCNTLCNKLIKYYTKKRNSLAHV